MKNIRLTLLVFSSLLLAISCNKNNDNPEPVTAMEQLIIPDGFTFESTMEKDVTIIMPASVDFTTLRSRVNVFTDLPLNGGVLLSSAAVVENGMSAIRVKVPTALKQLYVETLAGTALVSIGSSQNQKEGEIVIDFNEPMIFTEPTSIDGQKSIGLYDTEIEGLNLKQAGSVVNLIQNGDFSANVFGTMNDWTSPMTSNGKWYITSTLGVNYAKQYLQAGEKMLRITSSPARYGGVAQLVPAQPGDLITLTSDIRSNGNGSNLSWLYLIPRNATGQSIAYISIQTNNTNNNWIRKTVAASMPPGTVAVQVLLWNHIYGGAIDYDNIIVTGPVDDSDNDGVDNDLDDYPDDAARAFNVYYPNASDFGSLAFEDLWPGKGDYDFNDLVFDYKLKQVLNANNRLVEFYMDYSVRAIGASFENGFGIEIPGTSSNSISSVTGTHLTESYVTLNANGTEAGQDNAVIILFDNAFSMMANPTTGFVINTSLDAPWVEPRLNQLYVSFAQPVLFQNTGMAPYNPFLIVNKERGREVHLPGKTPTSLADETLLGTWFDNSNPLTGKYYQSESNLPWAIDLPVQFDYVIEKTEIVTAHLKFASWAESNGSLFPDWYKALSGYRNTSLIYTHN
ncbi:MAG: LruC domain-containing protein [Bacteroidales bacterium]|nr:LruC domain-containing protein [Bacteroidales bacterium]